MISIFVVAGCIHLLKIVLIRNKLANEWPELMGDGQEKGMFFVYSFLFGQLSGALILGAMADKFGRKWIFLGTSVAAALSSFLVVFAPSYWVFAAIHFITAFATGTFPLSFILLQSLHFKMLGGGAVNDFVVYPEFTSEFYIVRQTIYLVFLGCGSGKYYILHWHAC